MIDALVYLETRRLINAARQKLKRLRQPRYLFGALAGLAYLYVSVLRFAFRNHSAPGPAFVPPFNSAPALLEAMAAIFLMLPMLGAWIFPGGRATLNFTEAEVAFLFPAPISRRALVHYKLLRAQLGIFISSLLLSFVSQRWVFLGGGQWMHLVGWWLILSFLNLHLVAAGFTRDRLLDLGVSSVLRRVLIVGGLLALVAVSVFWIRRTAPSAAPDNLDGLSRYTVEILAQPPVGWLLWPARIVVRPFLASSLTAFGLALGPAVLLIALQYLWVIQAETAFEEATLFRARRRTEMIENARKGGPFLRKAPTRAQRDPFRLAAHGPRVIAIFWRRLIEMGTFYYPSTWLKFSAVPLIVVLWLARHPEYKPFLQVAGIISLTFSVYALIFGPIFAARSAQRLLERLELFKPVPLRGWEVVLGELITPVAVLTWIEWTLLGVFTIVVLHHVAPAKIPADLLLGGTAALAVLVIPLSAILFALNLFGVLYFPAWVTVGGSAGGPGLEKLGQRLILTAGYLLILLVALLPAAVVGGGLGLLCQYFFASLPITFAVGTPVAALILAAELACAVWWLGRRYEAFDLSAELPR